MTTSAAKYRIGIIRGTAPGASEAIDVAVGVLDGIGIGIDRCEFDIGPDRFLRTGELLPPEIVAELKEQDALLVGSPPASDNPAIPPGVLERGIVFGLRRELGLAVNLRILRAAGEHGADVAIVRENSEGSYSAEGSVLHPNTPDETAVEVSASTYAATEHCVRFAFDLARSRGGRLTLAHKARVLLASGRLWERVVRDLAAEYPDVRVNTENIDTCCARMVTDPGRYDVIVTDNLFGDILTDVACAATDSAPWASSAELTSLPQGPSLFEPMHGPQDAGPGGEIRTNPLGAINAAAMMLRHLGEVQAGNALWRTTLDLAAHPSASQHAPDAALVHDVVVAALALMKESN
jgi:3-isopropylmalate dehydrogenase